MQLSILIIVTQLDNILFYILDGFLLNIACFLSLMIYGFRFSSNHSPEVIDTLCGRPQKTVDS